jgi:hypothetical protein
MGRHKTLKEPKTAMGKRIRLAFGNATDAEISRRIYGDDAKKKEDSIARWVWGKKGPNLELIIRTIEVTHCSDAWLLRNAGTMKLREKDYSEHGIVADDLVDYGGPDRRS